MSDPDQVILELWRLTQWFYYLFMVHLHVNLKVVSDTSNKITAIAYSEILSS